MAVCEVPLPVYGPLLVSLCGSNSTAVMGRHSGCPVGRLVGGVGGAVTQAARHRHEVCWLWMRPLPLLPIPHPFVCGSRSKKFKAGRGLRLHRFWVSSWTKAGHFGCSWGGPYVGRRPGWREVRCSWAEHASQVRARSHGHAGGLVAGG